jgi:uncharacterized protein (UPF0264 family)
VRLLVSVATPEEAAAAVRGGADIVDAKDPRRGALGAVSLPVFCAIRETVGQRAPVSAALGDASTAIDVERDARAFATAGAAFVKVGFAGVPTDRIGVLLDAALQGTPDVVAVAYADARSAGAPDPRVVISAASRAGVRGLLIDTADKTGRGLRDVADASVIADWVAQARQAGLFVALAGKLTLDDLMALRDARADIVGVRGAACEGGRSGTVSEQRVRALRDAVHAMSLALT